VYYEPEHYLKKDDHYHGRYQYAHGIFHCRIDPFESFPVQIHEIPLFPKVAGSFLPAFFNCFLLFAEDLVKELGIFPKLAAELVIN